MKLSGTCRNVLMAVFTVLLSLGYVSSTMCWHTHVIGGQVIVHSHLFGKSHANPNTDGGHTAGQLQTIQEANDLTFTDVVIPEFHIERIEVLTFLFCYANQWLSQSRGKLCNGAEREVRETCGPARNHSVTLAHYTG